MSVISSEIIFREKSRQYRACDCRKSFSRMIIDGVSHATKNDSYVVL